MTDPSSEQPPVALRLGDVVKRSEPGRDRRGVVIATVVLANAPVENWPAAEFHQAMVDAGFEHLLRIDVLSHLLDTVNGHGTRPFTHQTTVEASRP